MKYRLGTRGDMMERYRCSPPATPPPDAARRANVFVSNTL
jgi:hypothetical protein